MLHVVCIRTPLDSNSTSPPAVSHRSTLAGLAVKLSSGAKTTPTSMQPFHRRAMLLTGAAARESAQRRRLLRTRHTRPGTEGVALSAIMSLLKTEQARQAEQAQNCCDRFDRGA